jgi:hypothetical protein
MMKLANNIIIDEQYLILPPLHPRYFKVILLGEIAYLARLHNLYSCRQAAQLSESPW